MSMKRVIKVIDRFTNDELVKSIINSVNENQEKSKEWLVTNSEKYIQIIDNPKIVVLAGWYGNLANRLKQYGKVKSIDINEWCEAIGKKLYDDVKFETKDIREYDTSKFDVITCTSCEHFTQTDFEKIYSKIKVGSLVILQSNNYYQIKEHLNCFDSLEDFKNSVPFSKLLYKGELKLPKYTRFLLVGIR